MLYNNKMIYRLYTRITSKVCLDCFVPRNDDDTQRHCETPMKASNKRKMTKEKKCHSERSEESLRLAYLLLRCDSSLRSE